MGPTVEAFIDHACPYSFMAFAALCELARADAVGLRWRMLPITEAGHLDPAEAGMHALRQTTTWPQIQALAASSFGLRLAAPRPGIDGRPSAALALWADRRDAAAGLRMHRLLFEACFHTGQDIADPDVLTALAIAAGLGPIDPPGLLSPAAVAASLREDSEVAARRGVTVVPAIMFGDHLLLGAQPTAVLREGLGLVSIGTGPVGAPPREREWR